MFQIMMNIFGVSKPVSLGPGGPQMFSTREEAWDALHAYVASRPAECNCTRLCNVVAIPHELQFIVSGADLLGRKQAVFITATAIDPITTPDQLYSALCEAVRLWTQETKTGKATLRSLGPSMDIYDIMPYVDEILQYTVRITSLTIEPIEVAATWCTQYTVHSPQAGSPPIQV